MSIPPIDATIKIDRKVLTKSRLFVLVCILGFFAFTYVLFVYGTYLLSESAVVTQSDTMSEGEMTPTFTLVPDAITEITLTSPVPYNDIDVAYYEKVVRQYTSAELESFSTSSFSDIIVPGGATIDSVLMSEYHKERFLNIFNEIHALLAEFNTEWRVAPLYEFSPLVKQIGAPEKVSDEPAVYEVYPNARATTAFMVARYLSIYYPMDADFYRDKAVAYSEQGIAMGWYGVESIRQSQNLVEQYFALIPPETFFPNGKTAE